MGHLINRTSPKGKGMPFIGTCALCGQTGLRAEQVNEDCPNQRGLTQDEALLEAVTGEPQCKDSTNEKR